MELRKLERAARSGGLLVVYGRRRLGKKRLLQQLVDASVLERFMPFGESLRTTKKLRYRIRARSAGL